MKPIKPKSVNRIDILFILGIGVFFFSCIATTYRTAKTLEPGQASLSTGYMQARSVEEMSGEPVQLVGLNGRIGVSRGFDLGTEYTWDISKENENAFGTIWGDCKIQLTNKDNEFLKPVLSTGLLKGYIHHEEAKIHVSSLPVMLSLPINDRVNSTFLYRYELFSEGFVPTSLVDPRHTFALGVEYGLSKPDNQKWATKLTFSVGTLNSLDGCSEGDNVLIFNLGFIFNSPYKTVATP